VRLALPKQVLAGCPRDHLGVLAGAWSR
jgi:hypothetical protein